MLTQERLKELVHYDPLTGVFTSLIDRHYLVKKGQKIGYTNKKSGYYFIAIDGKNYYGHILAWLYIFGKYPDKDKEIDHINLIRNDNRLENLRECYHNQNTSNEKLRCSSTTGLKGVTFHKKANKYMASITHNYKSIYLGLFETPEEAHEAYCAAAKNIQGEFFRKK